VVVAGYRCRDDLTSGQLLHLDMAKVDVVSRLFFSTSLYFFWFLYNINVHYGHVFSQFVDLYLFFRFIASPAVLYS